MTFTFNDFVSIFRGGSYLFNISLTEKVPTLITQYNFIGKSRTDVNPTFFGYIDEIRIYSWDLFGIIPPFLYNISCFGNCATCETGGGTCKTCLAQFVKTTFQRCIKYYKI